MDRQYLQAGATPEFFYFKAKPGLIEVLLSQVKEEGDPLILDIGAGSGEELSIIRRFGKIHLVEPDPLFIKGIPEDWVVEKHACELSRISYQDDFFDWVLAFDVLEHIEDDRAAVREIKRILKPGGYLIISVPAVKGLFGPHDRALDHFRRYNKPMVRELLSDFQCLALGFWVFFLFLPIALQRLLKKRSSTPHVQFMHLPKAINQTFVSLLHFETWLIKQGIPLPIGTTLYGIFRKM